MAQRRVADEVMSLPRLCCSTVEVIGRCGMAAGEKMADAPVLFAAELYVRHQSFNELVRGLLRAARVELFLRSGWVPTQIAFARAPGRGCLCWPFFASRSGDGEDERDTRIVVSEETYRAHHAALFWRDGIPLQCEVRMERDMELTFTASFELYVCVRDTLAMMGIETNLRFYSPETAAIVRQPTIGSIGQESE